MMVRHIEHKNSTIGSESDQEVLSEDYHHHATPMLNSANLSMNMGTLPEIDSRQQTINVEAVDQSSDEEYCFTNASKKQSIIYKGN